MTAPGSTPSGEDETPGVERFEDVDSLREHLDVLNETGIGTDAAGVTRHGDPFLITLQGPYAESATVIFGSPWDGEIDWNNGLRCEDCNASNLHDITDLAFPVHVFLRPEVPR